MKPVSFLCLFVLLFMPFSIWAEGAEIDYVLPETITHIELSNSDINRIVCPSDIKDMIVSKEKGITTHVKGKDGFIKFLIKKEYIPELGREELIYSTTPSEIYIKCGGLTYTLIAIPKKIPAQTLRLSAGRLSVIKKNESLFKGLAHEERITRLIQSVYADQIEESFTVTDINKPLYIFPDLELTLIRIVDVEGEGMRVKEYTAQLKDKKRRKELRETDFLRPEITKKPLALSLDPIIVVKDETTRIFIVESRDEE
jgi:conjugal transfer pilus assembly protein TraK